MRASFLAIVGASLIACGSHHDDSGFASGTPEAGSFGGSDGGPSGMLGEGGMGVSVGSCPQETQFVYTLAADNSLYRFEPPSLTFTLVGVLDCPSSVASPYSMAVDRGGKAWVVFTDGTLYNVDTSNAACTPTTFAPLQAGFLTFGMGFSANTAGGDAETLFVSDSAEGTGSTKGLARIDTQALTLTPIGQYDKLNARSEMTGTGDARLFGAFEGTPYVVAEIDKTDAHILSQAPQSAINYPPGSSNFAFAFWGGDFWLFVGPGGSTDVFQYTPSSKVTTKVKTVQFEIVGAGVSTCAPTMTAQ